MAIIRIKNIHNHKIKAGFRNEPLPPYFDGYVDTETGNIVDPNTNINEFLQSVKDEVNTKIGSIDDFIKASQDALADQNNQLSKFISDGQSELDSSKASVTDVLDKLVEAFNKNNEVLIEYVFNNTQFAGKKEIAISNNTPIDVNTAKFIKNVRVVGYMSVYKGYTPKPLGKYEGWSYGYNSMISGTENKRYDFDKTFSFSDRGIENINLNEPNGFYVILDKSGISSDKITINASPNVSRYDLPGTETYTNCNVYKNVPGAGPGSRGSHYEADDATIEVTRYYSINVYIQQIYIISE